MSESEIVTSKVMKNEDWAASWDRDSIGFHKEYINPLLEKYMSKLVNGRSNIKIFVPLCGKSWDMKWLADQGHTVVGVEVVQKAIKDFFKEQNIVFTSEPAPAVDGMLFQSEDKKIQLFCCDFFKFNKDVAGQVDGVYDRASLVAINRNDRARYASLMKSLMSVDCRYLISILQYDASKYSGPPHSVDDADLEELFGDFYNVTEIESIDAFEEKHRKWGIEKLTEKAFLISPK